MTSRPSVRNAVVGLGLIFAISTTGYGCSSEREVSKPQYEFSRKLYSDAELMATDSSAIVTGRLGSVVARTVDDGGQPGGIGVPAVLYEFEVAAGSKGVNLPTKITIASTDTEKIDSSDAVSLTTGNSYLLFLERVNESGRGGLSGYGTLYVPVSGIAGIFEIKAGKAHAVDPEVKKLRGKTEPSVDGRMSTDPDKLLQLSPQKS